MRLLLFDSLNFSNVGTKKNLTKPPDIINLRHDSAKNFIFWNS